MDKLARTLFAFLFLMICTVAAAQTAKSAKETGTIAGRVLIAGKGVPHARVRLYNPGQMQSGPMKTSTDLEGHFTFNNLAPGSYFVMAFSGPYVAPSDQKGMSLGKSVTVEEGETVDGLDFSLVRGGVLTGRITDLRGKPLIGETIHLLGATGQPLEGQLNPAATESLSTDDRGVFRIFGLPAGRYMVAVGGTNSSVGQATPASYMRTYYPDAEQSQAKVVDVAEGGEVTDIDITVIRPQKGYTATGRVIDEATGKPASNLQVITRMVTADGKRQIGMGPVTVVDARGNFRLESLAPGHYSVLTSGDQNQGINESGQFEITDKDLSGIELKHKRGVIVTGQAVLGTDDPQAQAQLGRLQFQGYLMGRGASGVSVIPNITLNPDGSFRVAGVTAGVLNLSLVPGVNKNFSILQIERNGVPQSGPVNIAPGENVSLKVILGYGTGTVRGQFKVENGGLPQGVEVVAMIFAFGKPALIQSQLADARGRFLFEGLGSGEYEVVVQAHVPAKREPFGDVVKERISVRSGSESQVTLTLDVSKIKKPDGGAAGN